MSRLGLVIINTILVGLLISQVAAQLTITPKDTTLRIEESDGRVAREEALTPPAAAKGSLRLDHTEILKVGVQPGGLPRPCCPTVAWLV